MFVKSVFMPLIENPRMGMSAIKASRDMSLSLMNNIKRNYHYTNKQGETSFLTNKDLSPTDPMLQIPEAARRKHVHVYEPTSQLKLAQIDKQISQNRFKTYKGAPANTVLNIPKHDLQSSIQPISGGFKLNFDSSQTTQRRTGRSTSTGAGNVNFTFGGAHFDKTTFKSN